MSAQYSDEEIVGEALDMIEDGMSLAEVAQVLGVGANHLAALLASSQQANMEGWNNYDDPYNLNSDTDYGDIEQAYDPWGDYEFSDPKSEGDFN